MPGNSRVEGMKRYGPLLTLLVVAVLGAILFVANRVGDPANQTAATAAATRAAATPAPAAAPTAAPTTAAAAPTTAPANVAAAVNNTAYAGRTSGNEATIALAVKDGKAIAYVCDGKGVEAWLQGTVTGSTLTLNGKTSQVSGTVSDANAFGTITVSGKQWPFSAQAVKAPNGLYQGRADVKGVVNRIGWIVLPDGTQTGILNAGGQLRPAPPLDPARPNGVVIDGVPVTVQMPAGDDQVVAP